MSKSESAISRRLEVASPKKSHLTPNPGGAEVHGVSEYI